ncbi:general substrate transporter [Phyllosticta capitalensis]|uniref:General substrate transporter n=2 Tax=Phyllosticta capitalensis TaxID=121624 RepID=A0ABR1YHC5_9PEZI
MPCTPSLPIFTTIKMSKAVRGAAQLETLQNNTNPKWWKDAGLRRLLFWQGCVLVSQMTVGYDESVIGSLQTMQPWVDDMGNPSSSDLGLITAILFVGGVVGAFFASSLADRYGRRASIAFGSFLCIVGTALQSAAQGKGMFIGGRFIIGLGTSFTISAGPSLLNELSHPRMRGQIASTFNVLWYVGSIVASWLTFGTGHLSTTWSWRIPSIVQGAPSVFVIISTIFMPESPRFLYARGRTDEALAVLAEYHANGDYNDPLVVGELSQIAAALELDAVSAATSWRKILKSRPNRRRLGVVFAVAVLALWSGQSAISYYFSQILTSVGITATNAQTGINGGMQIWNLLCSITGVILAERLGRRPLWLISFVGMLCANVPLTIAAARYAAAGSSAAGYVTVVFMFLYNAAFNIACNPLVYAYPAEILPYSIRTKGLGFFLVVADALLVWNSYVNPIALERIGYWMFVCYAGFLAVAIGIIWQWFPETKGMTLEELAELFTDDTEIIGIECGSQSSKEDGRVTVVPKGVDEVEGKTIEA